MRNVRVEPVKAGEIVCVHELRRVPFAEVGDVLPYGSPHGPLVDVVWKPMSFGLLVECEEMKNRKDLNTPGKLVAAQMAHALSSLGDRDMTLGKEANHVNAVAALSVGDVKFLTMRWKMLREPTMVLENQQCTHCDAVFDRLEIDLGTMDVDVRPDTVTEENPLVARVGLRHGFRHGDRRVQTVAVGVPSWQDTYYLLSEQDSQSGGKILGRLVVASICGTDADYEGAIRPRVTQTEVYSMHPADVQLIAEALGRIMPTPYMVVASRCPSCGKDSLLQMNWQDADFT